MALELVSILPIDLITQDTAAFTGAATGSRVTSPAPPWGAAWWQMTTTDGGGANSLIATARQETARQSGLSANYWTVVGAFDLDTTPTVDDQYFAILMLGDGVDSSLFWLMGRTTAGGKFKISIKGDGGLALDGTVEFDPDEYIYRLTADGTTVTVELDGVQALSAASTWKPTSSDIDIGKSAAVTTFSSTRKYATAAMFKGSSSADRADDLLESFMPTKTGDGTHTDYTGAYTDWDDWDSGANDGDTSICEGVNTTDFRETSALSTFTFTKQVRGARGFVYMRNGAAGSKSISNWFTFRVNGTDNDQALSSTTQNTYTLFNRVLALEMSQGDVDGMEAGHRRANDAANLKVTAMGLVVVAVNADPPATGGDRRRLLAGFV